MNDNPYQGRVKFHDSLSVMEVDFSSLTFANNSEVDAFYDETDRLLQRSGKRWYFLVVYNDCDVLPEAWDRFSQRGKQTNIAHSLGTVRVVASEQTRDSIRDQAKEEQKFRANIYDNRDDALFALGEMRKRHDVTGVRDSVTTEALLSVRDVNLSFGGIQALQNIGFDVQRGEIFSIIGPNGAGKTSMINVISGFYRPNRGQIIFDGVDCTNHTPDQVAKLGFARTFQNIALFKGMSTLDNIMTGCIHRVKTNIFLQGLYFGPARREEIKNRAHVENIIDFLEIQSIRKTPVGRLPYGMQKRVELARALAMEPKVLLLDEPMAGMNLEEKEDMVRFILEVNEEWGTTILLIEHDMGVVMDISTQVVVLDHGKKIADGTTDEIRNDPAVIRAYLGVTHE